MYNFSDDELDAFFQKATESNKLGFNNGAWQKMEQKLDRQKRLRFLFWGCSGASILVTLVAGLIWWGAFRSGQPASDMTDITPPQVSGQLSVQGGQSAIRNGQAEPIDVRNGATGPDSSAHGAEPTIERLKSPGGKIGTTDQSSSKNSIKTDQQTIGSVKKSLRQLNRLNGNKRPAVVQTTAQLEVPPVLSVPNPQVVFDQLNYLSQLPLLPMPSPKLLAISVTGPPVEPIISTVEPVAVIATTSLPRLAVGLLVSPDLSYTDMGDVGSPGFKFGLETELRLTRSLSVATGLIYSQMRYQTAPENYKAPYSGFWPGGQKPFGASGQCAVLELPVNLRVSFAQNPHRRFFAGVGLSSYLMLTEDYTFNYYNVTNNRYWNWKYAVNNQSRHWFGIVNLSVGYTRQLSPRLGLQIEPFVKVPLAGVGMGKINLNTAGAFFSVRYGFGRPKR